MRNPRAPGQVVAASKAHTWREGVTSIIKVLNRRAAGMGYTFQVSKYMNGYHFHFKVYQWGIFFTQKVYEWEQFLLLEVYEWYVLTSPSI